MSHTLSPTRIRGVQIFGEQPETTANSESAADTFSDTFRFAARRPNFSKASQALPEPDFSAMDTLNQTLGQADATPAPPTFAAATTGEISLADLRTAVETRAASRPAGTAPDSALHVPTFKDLATLAQEALAKPSDRNSTLDQMRSNYEDTRRRLTRDLTQARHALGSADVGIAKQAMATAAQFENALFRLSREVESLETFRRHHNS